MDTNELVRRVKGRKPSKKGMLWIENYLGPANFNATEAARLMGFRHPGTIGPRMLRLYKDILDAAVEERAEQMRAEGREVLEILTEVARDKDHKDRVRAAEALARIHGQFNDKISINTDRKALSKELEDLLASIPKVGNKES